jgi:hypothetical protein
MKERIIAEMNKPMVWGASPHQTPKETMVIIVITGVCLAVTKALGLL